MATFEATVQMRQAEIPVVNVFWVDSSSAGAFGSAIAERVFKAYKEAWLPLMCDTLDLELVDIKRVGGINDGAYSQSPTPSGAFSGTCSSVNNAIRMRKTAVGTRSKGWMYMPSIAEVYLSDGATITSTATGTWNTAGQNFLNLLNGTSTLIDPGGLDCDLQHRYKSGPSTFSYADVSSLDAVSRIGSMGRRLNNV